MRTAPVSGRSDPQPPGASFTAAAPDGAEDRGAPTGETAMTSTQKAVSTLTPGASPASLVSISAAADGSVWAADASGALYSCGTAATGWMSVPGTLTVVAAASDGTVLGLSATDGSVVTLNGTTWEPLS